MMRVELDREVNLRGQGCKMAREKAEAGGAGRRIRKRTEDCNTYMMMRSSAMQTT